MKSLGISTLRVLESVADSSDIALLRLSDHWHLFLSDPLLQAWRECVPASFRYRRHYRFLVVMTPSAGHALILHYSKDAVVSSINHYLGAGFIQDIVFSTIPPSLD